MVGPEFSLLALGDSYTVGEGGELLDSYPYQLAGRIKEKYQIEVSPIKVIARTGWTAEELLENIEKEEILQKYDLVFVLIGVNNQYRNLPLEEYVRDFETILQKAISFCVSANKGVWVLSIPDWSFTPFGQESGRGNVSSEIDRYNSVNFSLAEKHRCNYVSITKLTRQYTENQMFVDDKLHPSGQMYRLWVEEVLCFLKILQKK